MHFIIQMNSNDGLVEHAEADGIAGDNFVVEFSNCKITVRTMPETEDEQVVLARRTHEALQVAENYIRQKYPDDFQPLYFPR